MRNNSNSTCTCSARHHLHRSKRYTLHLTIFTSIVRLILHPPFRRSNRYRCTVNRISNHINILRTNTFTMLRRMGNNLASTHTCRITNSSGYIRNMPPRLRICKAPRRTGLLRPTCHTRHSNLPTQTHNASPCDRNHLSLMNDYANNRCHAARIAMPNSRTSFVT